MPTSLKEAFKKWEEKYNENILEAKDVNLSFQMPPIEKLDNSLATLTNCEKLSLSSNSIEKLTGFTGLRNLKILSLARNVIKSFAGLEPLGDTLEQLWISYNLIDKIKGNQQDKDMSWEIKLLFSNFRGKRFQGSESALHGQ